MGSSAKSHTYDVLRNRAREADAQVVNVHLDGRLYRREGHLFHPVGHATLVLQRSPTALQRAAERQRSRCQAPTTQDDAHARRPAEVETGNPR